MKRKLGEIQQINGKWYQLVKADKNNSCNGCSFFLSDNGKDCIIRCRNYGLIYKKLKIGGVPYSRDGKTYQTYIVPYTPYFYNGEYYACQAFDSRYFIAEINKEDMKENEENKYDGKMDKECIPLCDALNSLPDVETTESCCGHCKDRFRIFFKCKNPYSLSVIARVFNRRYSGTKLQWIIEVETHDNGGYNYFVHSVEAYENNAMMEKDISQLVENIKHWSSEKYKEHFINGVTNKEEKKLNLKSFNIEEAKAGKPVCTRDGRKARIICFDRANSKPILALIASTDGKGEDVFDYFVSGKRIANALESDLDLMMLPEKKEGWVNVYDADTTFRFVEGMVYNTKDESIQRAKEEVANGQREKNEYVDTVKICWEE